MNSVFNLASYNFNQLTDDELLSWLHSEGLANMPPIIRTLAERLEAVQQDVAYAQEEIEEVKEALRKFDADVTEGLGDLDLDEESPDDQIVVSRRQLDAIRAQIDSIGYVISNLETREFFPASPTV